MNDLLPVVQWTSFVIFSFIFITTASFNSVWMIRGYFLQNKVGTSVPLVGGICGAIGFAISPILMFQKIWWLPLILDVRCLPFAFDLLYRKVLRRK